MVESKAKSEQTAAVKEAIRSFLESGGPEEELHQLVRFEATVLDDRSTANGAHVGAGFNVNQEWADQELPVFEKLPDGLIDLPTAAKKYDIRVNTIRWWTRRGHVRVRARLRAPASGGGYLVVSESDLIGYMAAPRNKGGRPRKSSPPC